MALCGQFTAFAKIYSKVYVETVWLTESIDSYSLLLCLFPFIYCWDDPSQGPLVPMCITRPMNFNSSSSTVRGRHLVILEWGWRLGPNNRSSAYLLVSRAIFSRIKSFSNRLNQSIGLLSTGTGTSKFLLLVKNCIYLRTEVVGDRVELEGSGTSSSSESVWYSFASVRSSSLSLALCSSSDMSVFLDGPAILTRRHN